MAADASVAAGPVGRDAEASTDIQMRAKILSYSRTRGLFAGITLNGSTIKQDRDANERFYGRAYRSTELVIDRLGGAPDPVPAWRDELARVIQSSNRVGPAIGSGLKVGNKAAETAISGRTLRAAPLGGVSQIGTRLAPVEGHKRQLYGAKLSPTRSRPDPNLGQQFGECITSIDSLDGLMARIPCVLRIA